MRAVIAGTVAARIKVSFDCPLIRPPTGWLRPRPLSHTRPITTLAELTAHFYHSASSYSARTHKSRPLRYATTDVRFVLITGGKAEIPQSRVRARTGDS